MFKIKLFILALLCPMLSCLGQLTIKGKITDQQQALPFATVLLLAQDSAVVKGVMTENTGAFVFENIAPGHYFLSVSMVGYVKFHSSLITVDKNLAMPDITMNQSATALDEVSVTADKPLFEQQTDRLVVNVASSITSSGNTLLEVLQKSPGVVVNRQSNSIAINGKTGVRIMINDKVVQMPLDAVVQMLDGMSASNVEKIELITTPPAKYDAEGNGGIIHIVMKNNEDLGTNGSFGLTLGYRGAETLGANFAINHRAKKTAWFLDYSWLRDHNWHTMAMARTSVGDGFPVTVNDRSDRENWTTQQNLNAGFEWKPTTNSVLSLGITAYRRDWELTALAFDEQHLTADSIRNTRTNIQETNIWQSATVGLNYQTKINSKSDLNVSVDYLYYHNDNPSTYDNGVVDEHGNIPETSRIALSKVTPIHFLIGKADYRYSLSAAWTIDAGIKGVTSGLDNDVVVRRWLGGDEWIVDPFFSSHATLSENVSAAYVSTTWQPEKRWLVTGGLRYEYTHTHISTPVEQDVIDRKYGYFFPTLLVKKDLDVEKDLQFSYSRRINRPTFNDMAPYVFLWGPNTFSGGNTSLLPAVADAVKVGFHVKQWVVSLQYTHSRREINSYQAEIDTASNTLTYRAQNLDYLNTLGLTNSYSLNITPWWEAQGSVTVQYQIAQAAQVQHDVRKHLFGVNLNVVSIVKLPSDFAIEISGSYQSTMLSGIAVYLPQGSLNAGVQKKLGENGTLTLAMDDILYTNMWRIKTNSPENYVNDYFKYDFHNQYVRLTYKRNLGSRKIAAAKLKSGSDEERRRVN
ncbi:MAG TPA: TonB-dependent receptor [Chryseolinea sp.]